MREFSLTISKGSGGQIIISAMLDQQRVHRQYFLYPLSEALTEFLNEFGLTENDLEE